MIKMLKKMQSGFSDAAVGVRRLKGRIKSRQKIIALISVTVLPFILVMLMEAIHRGGMAEFSRWVAAEPGWFIMTVLFFSAVYAFFLSLTNDLFISILVFVVPWVALAIVSANKMAIREMPMMPWNITMLRELAVAVSESENLAYVFYISALPVFVLLVVIFYIAGNIGTGFKLKNRMVMLAVSATVIGVSIFLLYGTVRADSPGDGGSLFVRDTVKRYDRYGFAAAFMSYAMSPYMETPQGYTEEAAVDLAAGIDAETGVLAGEAADAEAGVPATGKGGGADLLPDGVLPEGVLPDIIVVLSEAFWDPSVMPGFIFNEDPLPNFHNLKESSIYGEIIVNPLGANTTNVEFEILTGFTTSLMQPELSAYYDVLSGVCSVPEALPAWLSGLGYYTEAIHPYYRFFLNRNEAFEKFGFHRFITEGFSHDRETDGLYVSDSAVFSMITSLYGRHGEAQPDMPYFSFAVTMQNHFDYRLSNYIGGRGQMPEWTGRYEYTGEGLLSDEENDIMAGYLKGIYDADRLLGNLIDYFTGVGRPVVLVFFGDHLPALGKGYSLLYKGGLISDPYPFGDNPAEDILKLHTVPFMIWDNFSGERGHAGAISAAYLKPLLLRAYGIPLGTFGKLMASVMDDAPFLGLAAWQDKLAGYTGEEIGYIIKKIKILQYHMLFSGK